MKIVNQILTLIPEVPTVRTETLGLSSEVTASPVNVGAWK